MKKVLVLRGGALGDFLVTLPALALLRQRWPNAQIDLIGNATAAQLALNRRLIDEVHSQHSVKWSAFYGCGPLPSALAAWLDGFDLVISYWPDPEGELRRRFPRHAGQSFLCGQPMPAFGPAAAHYCEPLSVLGMAMPEFPYPLTPHRPVGRRIALHPGSGSPKKNWPIDRWRTLAETLRRQSGLELLVVSGEADDAAAAALAGVGVPLRHLPLEQLVAELAGVVAFVGHDSGISHLAASCGVPSVLLFGPTDPAIWAPPTPQVTVLQRGVKLASISVEEVLRALDPILASAT